MCPLRIDFWAFFSRQLLAALAIFLAASLLSVVLFPAAHGSFVSTHGPATAFRSRRLFLTIRMLLTLVITLGVSSVQLLRLAIRVFRQCPSAGEPPVFFSSSIVLQC